MYFVYKITNMVNGKLYIGKTADVEARWAKHLSVAKTRSSNDYAYLHRAINKYGVESFTIEVIASYDLEKEALDAEIHYIAEIKTQDRSIGYNLTAGGDGMSGYQMSESAKEKNRQSHLGKKAAPETRKKMSEAHKGSKKTEATRQKMREARAKQAPMSEESRQKLSASKTGTKMSKESSIKKSEASRGEKNTSAKITEKDVIAIKLLRKQGQSRSQIQKILNVPLPTIDGIIYNQTWTHIIV